MEPRFQQKNSSNMRKIWHGTHEKSWDTSRSNFLGSHPIHLHLVPEAFSSAIAPEILGCAYEMNGDDLGSDIYLTPGDSCDLGWTRIWGYLGWFGYLLDGMFEYHDISLIYLISWWLIVSYFYCQLLSYLIFNLLPFPWHFRDISVTSWWFTRAHRP